MAWTTTLAGLVRRHGGTAKFAATTILNAVVPGAPAVVELVARVFDAAGMCQSYCT